VLCVRLVPPVRRTIYGDVVDALRHVSSPLTRSLVFALATASLHASLL
jgi:hypothetical protein